MKKQRIRLRRRGLTIGVAAMVVFALAGGIAYATIPGPDNVYNACMLKSLGTIRLIDKSLSPTSLLSHCTDRETEISWNQAGQPGPAGPQGAKGDPGAPGTNGTNGTNGKDGVAVTTASEPAGANCAGGGVQLTAVSGVSYVCNGKAGADGKDGINGTNGTDGKDGNLALAGRSCPDGSFVTGFDSSGDLVCAAPGEPPPPPPPPPPGEVRVDPVLLTFRTQLGTISEAQDVILQNITESDVVFFFDVAGANPADFILGDGCRILPAGGNCRLPVQFAPSDFGVRTATIRVHLPTGEVRGVALIGASNV